MAYSGVLSPPPRKFAGVCLSVCLYTIREKNYWSDFHESFTTDVSVDKESGLHFGNRPPHLDPDLAIFYNDSWAFCFDACMLDWAGFGQFEHTQSSVTSPCLLNYYLVLQSLVTMQVGLTTPCLPTESVSLMYRTHSLAHFPAMWCAPTHACTYSCLLINKLMLETQRAWFPHRWLCQSGN